MALSARNKALISAITSSATRLKAACRWSRTKKVIDIKTDSLYEIYVLLAALGDLKKIYHIKFLPGSKNAFPRSPVEKEGWSRFELWDKPSGKRLFQVCAGTAILDINEDKRHPDISFQVADSPEKPCAEHCTMIWDAKYRKNGEQGITHLEFAAFAHWIEVLKLRGKTSFPVVFSLLSPMQHNCLITNGASSTECDRERKRVCMKEVSGFGPNSIHTVKP